MRPFTLKSVFIVRGISSVIIPSLICDIYLEGVITEDKECNSEQQTYSYTTAHARLVTEGSNQDQAVMHSL